jgi:hypothetical protein
VLLFDPFATLGLSRVSRQNSANLQTSSTKLEAVVSELIGAVNQLLVRWATDRCAIRLAVVLNKVDALPTADGYEYPTNLLPHNGTPAGADLHTRCRDALERLGESCSLLAFEQKFERVQYFACSALSSQSGEPATVPGQSPPSLTPAPGLPGFLPGPRDGAGGDWSRAGPGHL